MKQLSIQEMIKTLPFSTEKRDELLAHYDTYDDAEKLTVVRVCNDAFDLMYDILFEKIKESGLLKESGRGYTLLEKKYSFENLMELLSKDSIRNKLIKVIEKKNGK